MVLGNNYKCLNEIKPMKYFSHLRKTNKCLLSLLIILTLFSQIVIQTSSKIELVDGTNRDIKDILREIVEEVFYHFH